MESSSPSLSALTPGYTILHEPTINSLFSPFAPLSAAPTAASKSKKIILLTSPSMTDDMIFCNGLSQNILNFYRMFEAMGYIPLILFDEKPAPEKTKDFIQSYRFVLPETVMKSEIPIYALLEVGMTIQPEFRQFLKDFGTKIMKIFLGNILNIDVEISTRMSDVNFPHHITGHYQLLLSSPHYNQNIKYAAAISHTPFDKSIVAPYVWSKKILNKSLAQKLTTTTWDAAKTWQERDIVIMEPNLGFQKCFYVPLLIAAAFARKHGATWKGKIRVYNFQNVMRNSNFVQNIAPLLQIPSDRLELFGRFSIADIMAANRGAVFIHHQVNNEFNYMFFELLSQDFPVLHNCQGWQKYGYYYTTDSATAAAATQTQASHQALAATPTQILYKVLREHQQNLEIYRSHYENLAWSHSIYNPQIHETWDEIIKNPLLDRILH